MIAKRSELPRHRYAVYGVALASDFPLASLPEEGDGAAQVELLLQSAAHFRARMPTVPEGPDDWIRHAVLADGSIYIRVEGVFETIVAADGRRAECLGQPGADPRAFEAQLLNFVLSTALTLQGEEPLHATVLDLGAGAVALLGPSGAGKSTLAACLIADGADLVTDDMLRLSLEDGAALAHPGPYRLKLFDEPARRYLAHAAELGSFDRLGEKLLMKPRRHAPSPGRPRPLVALFWLGEPAVSDEVTAHRLEGQALAKVLIASAMDIRYFAPARLARQLRFAEQIGRHLPVYGLAYPRRFAVLDRVAAEVRRIAGA